MPSQIVFRKRCPRCSLHYKTKLGRCPHCRDMNDEEAAAFRTQNLRQQAGRDKLARGLIIAGVVIAIVLAITNKA